MVEKARRGRGNRRGENTIISFVRSRCHDAYGCAVSHYDTHEAAKTKEEEPKKRGERGGEGGGKGGEDRTATAMNFALNVPTTNGFISFCRSRTTVGRSKRACRGGYSPWTNQHPTHAVALLSATNHRGTISRLSRNTLLEDSTCGGRNGDLASGIKRPRGFPFQRYDLLDFFIAQSKSNESLL
uniref:Uncharacterized protein n=1 Tax=Vespula pensylvanica TaxID=30213 RepID=A0A834UAR5_VESPE|nr:hypothetical protein H0235_006613 [Vespula pensylvanica]